MKKLGIIFLLLIAYLGCHAQETTNDAITLERISVGIGGGLNYGGFGANLLVYPHQKVGLFVGVGYALAGVGSNVGVKVNIHEGSKISPYALGMYGYYAAVKVKGASEYNRLFYGPSFGLGTDLKLKNQKSGYFSFAILVPIRNADADDYIDSLNNSGEIEFENKLLPIGFSAGYHFIIK